MATDVDEESDNNSGEIMTTLWLPQSMKNEIKARKQHWREPYYEVLRRLLDATKRKSASKSK